MIDECNEYLRRWRRDVLYILRAVEGPAFVLVIINTD
jgi:hypothetical protein